MLKRKQLARGLDVPLTAHPVDAPIIQYGGGMTAIHFITEDDRWGRVTFEKLDSIKASRGEYPPFSSAPHNEQKYRWVNTVANSRWLRERYEYEKKYYGDAYNFCGSVEEMLTDYSHYVFHFHDEFVEVLAAGIWFEEADTMLGNRDPDPDHPLLGLSNVEPAERFEHVGITCQVRRNPLPGDELKQRARLCSQIILEVAAELDGNAGSPWRLILRTRNGTPAIYLEGMLGKRVAVFDEIPDLAAIRPPIDKWLKGVRERRGEMGKT